MKILVACEQSGRVRDAFKALGHDAWSCDILPTDSLGQHLQCDITTVLNNGWDMIIAFPPCTDLCVSGAKWFAAKRASGQQQRAIDLFMAIANAPCERIAIENPIGIMSTQWRKPDQIIQPWQFGHGETKATCLWLKNLPPLKPTNIVEGREQRIWKMAPSPTRAKDRSLTFQGIAHAMATQWSNA
jgi:site-specific DNA-cytosine methylase